MLLNGAPAPEEMNYQCNDRDDQQRVNCAARNMISRPGQKPGYQEHEEDNQEKEVSQ